MVAQLIACFMTSIGFARIEREYGWRKRDGADEADHEDDVGER